MKIQLAITHFLIAILFLAITVSAEVINKELKFKKGTSSTTIEDTVKAGESHRYGFQANAEQNLSVTINSSDGNAAFGLYIDTPYGYNDIQNDDGQVSFRDAQALDSGAKTKDSQKGIDQDRTSFTGKLPYGSKQGTKSLYAIVVKSKKGSSAYSLQVSIK